ncbi:MAG: hypothetical protein HUU20_24170 [Pirellulales bacterium]|nr:hypothetical protein [Pirellulales bacterium]
MRRAIVVHGLCLLTASLGGLAGLGLAGEASPRSKTVYSVLREPLPPEDLSTRESDKEVVVEGPTFTYGLPKSSGIVGSLIACRQERAVVELVGPMDIVVDEYRLAAASASGKTQIVRQGKEQVVLQTEGVMRSGTAGRPELPYRLTTTVYNDGVVVAEITLQPRQALAVRQGIEFRVGARGRFRHCMHKTRSEHGAEAGPKALPAAGQIATFAGRTSCLQVFSEEAALAIFTDGGGLNLKDDKPEAATIQVHEAQADGVRLDLVQKIVALGPGDEPFLLKADDGCTFRVGLSVAPNRLPHPRWRDMRMFVWIGDAKHPYPTDEEILEVARLGFTLFQMHRLGTPGEPRPPADQLPRVIDRVHEAGMLFLWTENADLMYGVAPGVVELRDGGKWPLWQGFNYGGRYCATMDPYCDLAATCLASPNGLADYRQATWTRMFDRYQVDGQYVDDNLAYANCRLWKEHGHPRPVYDCLIELHDVNWRRRQLFRQRCPHAVLVEHCTKATFLPVIVDFDVHLYGEGYGFATLDRYWDHFGSLQSIPAQGCIFPGDTEGSRCAARVAYNYDLLTGGGQYSYICWRLWPEKFPYAAGVTSDERWFVQNYNLAQFYFGMYESDPYYFATSKHRFVTTAPQTYATVYRNRVWGDWLIALANMARQSQVTTLRLEASEQLGLRPEARYALYDVDQRSLQLHDGAGVGGGVAELTVPSDGLRLFSLRPVPERGPYHLWGGKRIAEQWNPAGGELTCELHGPPGLEDLVVLADPDRTIRDVKVQGQPARFVRDPASGVVHGQVVFAADPIRLHARCLPDSLSKLPEQTIPKLLAPPPAPQNTKRGS